MAEIVWEQKYFQARDIACIYIYSRRDSDEGEFFIGALQYLLNSDLYFTIKMLYTSNQQDYVGPDFPNEVGKRD